jgi:GTPase
MKIGIDEALLTRVQPREPLSSLVPGKGQIFDWEPTLSSAAELMAAPRGTDPRLLEEGRPTRAKRKQSYHERMDAKALARAELEEEKKAGAWSDDD